jgi:polyhydroxyalkanoate synthase
VIKNYLLGEDYPAFDLLHWNGDVTNLPAKWHCAYLRDLYRDNRLVIPDALSADGTPIDLRRITTPATSRRAAKTTSRRLKASGS